MTPSGESVANPLPRATLLRDQRDYASALLSARESGLLALLWDGDDRTATQMAARLGYSPQALNNHLKRLVAVGFLDRERRVIPGGGAEWVYRRCDR